MPMYTNLMPKFRQYSRTAMILHCTKKWSGNTEDGWLVWGNRSNLLVSSSVLWCRIYQTLLVVLLPEAFSKTKFHPFDQKWHWEKYFVLSRSVQWKWDFGGLRFGLLVPGQQKDLILVWVELWLICPEQSTEPSFCIVLHFVEAYWRFVSCDGWTVKNIHYSFPESTVQKRFCLLIENRIWHTGETEYTESDYAFLTYCLLCKYKILSYR